MCVCVQRTIGSLVIEYELLVLHLRTSTPLFVCVCVCIRGIHIKCNHFIHIEYLFTICPFSGIMAIIIIICLWNYTEPYTHRMRELGDKEVGNQGLSFQTTLLYSIHGYNTVQQFWFMDNQLCQPDKLTIPRSWILIPELFLTGKCIAYSRLTAAN